MTTMTKNMQKAKDNRQQENKVVTSPQLPYQAYAIVGSRDDPLTWKLPHHTRKVYRAIQGKLGYEHTVDWDNINQMVLYLSRQGVEGQRVQADSDAILKAAHHLAAHFSKAAKPLPDALAVLV